MLTHVPTYLLTYLRACGRRERPHPPNLLAYPVTSSFIYLRTYLLTCIIVTQRATRPSYIPIYSLSYLLYYKLTYSHRQATQGVAPGVTPIVWCNSLHSRYTPFVTLIITLFLLHQSLHSGQECNASVMSYTIQLV